jgi:hypothetical protein
MQTRKHFIQTAQTISQQSSTTSANKGTTQMRIAPTYLKARFKLLANLLGWDHEGPAWTRIGDQNHARIGHVWIEKNFYGWSINQMVSESGGESRITESRSAAEMASWLDGAIRVAELIERQRSAA